MFSCNAIDPRQLCTNIALMPFMQCTFLTCFHAKILGLKNLLQMQHLCHLCSVIFNMLLDFRFKELGSNIALILFMQCTLLTCFCAMIFCIIEFSTNKALMLFLYCIFYLSCLHCDNVKTFGLTDCLPGNKPRVSENTHSLGLQVATKGLHKLEKGQYKHCLLVLHQIINCLLVHIINIPETKFLKILQFWHININMPNIWLGWRWGRRWLY